MFNAIILIFSIAIFSIGCAQKDTLAQFKLDETKERALLNLRESTIQQDGTIRALFSTIYLNPVWQKKDTNLHYFLISHFDSRDIGLDRYTLKLANKKALSVVKLDNNCSLIDLFSITTPWSSYYEVLFDSDDNNLTLTYTIESNLSSSVVF